MDNQNRKILSISATVLILLLLSSAFFILSTSVSTANAQTSNSDLLQYEWTQLGADGGWTLSSDGPAPSKPNVAWTATFSGRGPMFAGTVTAFNGMVFGTTTEAVNAYDAFTGELKWTYEQAGANFQTSPTKIDDTYMFLDGDSGAGGLGYTLPAGTITNTTVTVLRTSDGSFVSNFTVIGVGFQPGAGGYFPGRYDSTLQFKYVRGYNAQTNELSYYAIDLSNPATPKLAWKHVFDESAEELAVGGGVVVIGTVNGAVIGMNASTGDVMWRSQKVGFAQYTATYVDGSFIQGSSSTTLTRYNATTGEIIWDKPQGGRAFFAFAGATAYGRFYQHNIAVPEGFVGCWDVETGDMLWKMPALYQIGYITPCVADGKLYLQRYSGTAAGVAAEQSTFSCFDAYTGNVLWELYGASVTHPSIAYGNLYLLMGNTIYCISDRNPQDWNMWRGNLDQPGIAQTSGPQDLSTPAWVFSAGPMTSSPAVVAGRVYFGSQDNKIYCLDAQTGAKIWDYTTNYRVFSSPAVVGGRLYTGADDGNIYCLNAITGEQIWETPAGGLTNYVFAGTWQPRSSPIIVGNRLYVGALDGKLYCLDTSNGDVVWAKQLGDAIHPIGGSPAYADGSVYICATNHNLYKLNANSGNIIWTTTSNASIARAYTDFFPWSTPVIFNNTVYWGAGPVYGTLVWYALDVDTGTQIWNVTNNRNQTPDTDYRFTGNTPTCQTPVLMQWNNSLSIMIVPEFMGISVRNANDGKLIWNQWIGHEVYSSPAYANETRTPKFYVGSDTYSITCFNATAAVMNDTANAVMSLYTTLSHVQSSPTLWNGNLYVTSADGNIYMFTDRAKADFTIYGATNKGEEMWNNETLIIAGKLYPAVNESSGYGSFATNGLPNATVHVTFTAPDGVTSVNMTTTTDAFGNFMVSYKPTAVGPWGYVAYYEGETKPSVVYNAAYTVYGTVNVISPTANPEPTATPEPTVAPTATPEPTVAPTATPEPTVAPTATPQPTVAPTTAAPSAEPTTAEGGLAVEYIYAAIAVIIIVVVVVAVYVYTKRK